MRKKFHERRDRVEDLKTETEKRRGKVVVVEEEEEEEEDGPEEFR